MNNLDGLLPELHRHLLDFLDLESASRCRCVCKALRRSMGCGIFICNFITLKDLPKMRETLSRGPSKIAVKFKNVPLLMKREKLCVELFKSLEGLTNIVALDMRGFVNPVITYKFSNLPNLQDLAVINNYDSFELITTLTRLHYDSSPFNNSVIRSTNLQEIRCNQQSFKLSSLSPNLTTKLHANIRREDITLLPQFTNLKDLFFEGAFDFFNTKVQLPLFTRLESLTLGSDASGSIDHIVANYMHLTKLVIDLSCILDPKVNVDRFSLLQQLKSLVFTNNISGVYSMQFLQHLTNLEQLTVSIMQTENFASCITSQKLTSLSYNCASDSPVISFTHLMALKKLRVGRNSCDNVIDLPTENLTFLRTVGRIALPLKNLQRLKSFGTALEHNEDFPPFLDLKLHDGSRLVVTNLTNLTSLNTFDDMLDDVTSLEILTRLRTLVLFAKYAQDPFSQPLHAEFLTKLTNLEKLEWHQRIHDAEFLRITEHLTRLTHIGVRYTSSDCSIALTKLTNLQAIRIHSSNTYKGLTAILEEALPHLVDIDSLQ